MLSPYDAEVVQGDGALPGLATLLDPDAFVALVREASPDSAAQTVRIDYLKYKPGVNCLVGYQLDSNGARRDVYARALRRGECGAARDDRAIEVVFFPHDRRLAGLRRFVHDDGRWQLRRLLPEQRAWWRGQVERLAYKPERRYVARLVVDGVPRAVIKVHAKEQYAAIQRTTGVAARGALRLPRVLGTNDEAGAIVYEWLPGRLAADALADPTWPIAAFATVGAALATLHGLPCEGVRHRSPREDSDAMQAAASAVGAVCPRRASCASALAERLAAELAPLRRPFGLIHGDFYAKQVLMENDTAALIDLDEAARGDQMSDLANAIAHLEWDALRGTLAYGRAEEARRALLEGYQQATHIPLSPSLDLHVAARLLLLAPHPFRRREPEWPAQTEAILERVAALAARGRR